MTTEYARRGRSLVNAIPSSWGIPPSDEQERDVWMRSKVKADLPLRRDLELARKDTRLLNILRQAIISERK